MTIEAGPRILRERTFSGGPFEECHAPTIAEAEGGDLLVSFFAGTEEGGKDVSIWLTAYNDGRWSPQRRIAWDEDAPCWNPVLFKDARSAIHLFYKVGFSPETWTGARMISRDGGESWSEPEHFPAGILGPTKNKPLTMSNGEVICGTSVESYKAWACWAEVFDERTWRRFGPIYHEGAAKGVIQPSVVELTQGRLKMFMRSTQAIGRVCTAESYNHGRTWGKVRATVLPNPNSGIDVVRLSTGPIIIAYNDSTVHRTPLSLAASFDEGETWAKLLDLETEEGEFSYPSLIQSMDGDLHIAYTWRRKTINHVSLGSDEVQAMLDRQR